MRAASRSSSRNGHVKARRDRHRMGADPKERPHEGEVRRQLLQRSPAGVGWVEVSGGRHHGRRIPPMRDRAIATTVGTPQSSVTIEHRTSMPTWTNASTYEATTPGHSPASSSPSIGRPFVQAMVNESRSITSSNPPRRHQQRAPLGERPCPHPAQRCRPADPREGEALAPPRRLIEQVEAFGIYCLARHRVERGDDEGLGPRRSGCHPIQRFAQRCCPRGAGIEVVPAGVDLVAMPSPGRIGDRRHRVGDLRLLWLGVVPSHPANDGPDRVDDMGLEPENPGPVVGHHHRARRRPDHDRPVEA